MTSGLNEKRAFILQRPPNALLTDFPATIVLVKLTNSEYKQTNSHGNYNDLLKRGLLESNVLFVTMKVFPKFASK